MLKSLFPETVDPAGAVAERLEAGEHSTAVVAATTAVGGLGEAPDTAGMTLVLDLLGFARSTLHVDVDATRDSLAKAIALLERHAATGSRPVPPMKRPRGGLARWQVNRIAAYVEANIGSPIRASDLAVLVRLSASHFFHAFKESFTETPLAYVARRRMAVAQHLMLNTDQPLAQIALACGLCDQSHFTRVFRRVVGMSPHAWRREHACSSLRVGPAPSKYGTGFAAGTRDTSVAA
jgi:AraC family transcriptional regulator